MMETWVNRDPMGKAANRAPTFQCLRILPRAASSALADRLAHLVPQEARAMLGQRVEMAHLEVLANLAVLAHRDHLGLLEMLAELDNLVPKVRLAMPERLVPKDPLVTQDPPDHLAQLPAKATMGNPVKQAPVDRLDPLDLRETRPTMAPPANQARPDLLAHLAKMLSIVLALRVLHDDEKKATRTD